MNGITHKQAIQWIDRRLDGLLNESQLSALDEHLKSCDSCRAYAADMHGLAAHMQNEFHRRWDETPEPSQSVMKHVTAKARRIPLSNRISSGAKLLAGAMALVVLGVAINFVVSRLQSTSPAANATETVDNASLAQNRLLAFASDQNGNSDIYTMHADGSGLTNLTNHPAVDTTPFWSPDGKRIAFQREQNGFHQIYLMNADGSNVVQLTNDEAHHYLPMNIDGKSNPWSPDGSKLLFLQQEPRAELSTLYSTEIEGGNMVMLASGNIQYNNLSWSPDGKRVGYVLNESPTPDTTFVPGIYAIESSGNSAVAVSKLVPQAESVANRSYYWSPAGNSMIFIAHRHIDEGQDRWVVYEASLVDVQLVERATSSGYMEDWWQGTSFIRDLDGQSLRWLRADGTFNVLKPTEICPSSADSSNGFLAHRSPKGSQIVNVVCPNNQMLFYYVNSDATIIKPLLDFSIPAFAMDNSMTNMAWSPDDRFVAISLISPKKSTLYILNVKDNSKSEEIILSEGDFYAIPSWQPIVDENIAEEIPTPQPPSISSSQRLIAFASDQTGNSDIYTMQADGSEMRNLTNNPAADISPFWSPDGQRIAFASNRSGSMQIYLMDADGSKVVQLTNGGGSYGFDVNGFTPWSPDSRKLITVHTSPEGQNAKLYVIDIYEKTITSLTNEPGIYLLPSWSSDGKYIAFADITSQTREDVFIVGSDGTHLTRLTENLPGGEFVMFDYYWSQDGKKLNFIAVGGTNSATVYTASPDGSLTVVHRGERNILDWWKGTALLDNREGTLTWLRPDGSQSTLDHCKNSELVGTPLKRSNRESLFFVVNCSSNEWMFYWANPDGTVIDPLLDSPISIEENSFFNPIWSLDDRYIALVGNGALYVLDVAKAREDPSTQPLKLTNSFNPSWQPVASQEIVEEEPMSVPTPDISEVIPPIGTGKANGEWIAFIGGEAGPDPVPVNLDVYMIHPDGSGLVNLTQSPAHYYYLQWSPDGQHLSFVRNTADNKTDIMIHHVGETSPEVLASTVFYPVEYTPNTYFAYSWSPDSKQIAFLDKRAGNYDIYTIDADGSNEPELRQLTNDPGQEIDFAWSPDGSQLAFQRLDGDKLSIYVMNEDGSNQHEVARGVGRVSLRWSTDGKSIYANSVYRGPAESQHSHLECEGCVVKPAIYRIDLNEQSVQQIYNLEDPNKAEGWYLYDSPQNTLYFMRGKPQSFVGIWGTWFRADGNSLEEIGELDPHQTCKTTTGNILNEHISPNNRFSIISNFCAGGFDLYLADREAPNPEQKLVHLLQLPLNTWGQGGDNATLPMLWSPDGRWLVYDDGNQSMYLLEIEQILQDPTTEPVILFQSDSNLFMFPELAWQPKP